MKLLKFFQKAPPSSPPSRSQETVAETSSGQGRFVPGAALARERFLEAAGSYVRQKDETHLRWLHAKPYDASPGNAVFFTEMYQVLNLLEAMRIAPQGRVLEVGSGPGWVTEILAALRFEVVAVEPSTDMIGIARDRLAAAGSRLSPGEPFDVSFLPRAIEDCELAEESFDAVVFHESLHHVLDERKALRVCFEALRKGGVLGVSEWAWRPGDADLERDLLAEMEKSGTLESPFQPEYLDLLLREAGFSEVQRYHAINGFFPASAGDRPLSGLAQGHAASTNNLTARKPSPWGVTSADAPHQTRGTVTVLEQGSAAGGAVTLKLGIANTGETTWLPQAPRAGSVSVGFRTRPEGGSAEEVAPRESFESPVPPGRSFEMDVTLRPLPGHQDLEVGLVLERIDWIATAAIPRSSGPTSV